MNSAPSHRRRRGMALFAALILLLLVAALVLQVTQIAVRNSADLRQRVQVTQSRLLAESGLQRGLARRTHDADYLGETWNVPAHELDSPHSAHVTIRVETLPSATEAVAIVVTAEFPATGPRKVVTQVTWTGNVNEDRP